MSEHAAFIKPGVAREALEELGERIAAHYGVPREHVRYLESFHFDGRRWTLHTGWERVIAGVWVEEKWPHPWSG